MNTERKFGRILKLIRHYCIFFLIVAFVVTCCMMLFVETMAESMGLVLTNESIQVAAKITFANVMLLSLILTFLDVLRRHFTVERSAQKIIDAAKCITDGDFSVRIPQGFSLDSEDKFNEIAYYINKMTEELSSVETLRTDFIANVSHELKTPLAVMQNYGTMLQQNGLTDEKRIEYAKEITASSRRLANLITNILKLNKLENQQIAPNISVYDLGEQLCECLLGFEETWEKKQIEIETDIEEGVLVSSDAEMMSLVWNNLFSNAIKFTEAGGSVSLSLKTEGEFALVRVSDTGCGISPDIGKHIFDKFYQGDTSRASQGNGLGLALVKRVIDITGSDISVESEEGKGSTFTVRMRKGVS